MAKGTPKVLSKKARAAADKRRRQANEFEKRLQGVRDLLKKGEFVYVERR